MTLSRRLAGAFLAAATLSGLAAATPAHAGDGPLVAFVSPEDGASVSGTVAIEADAFSMDDSVDVVGISFAVDGQSVGSDSTYPYTASWQATPGTHIISAEATDSLGDTGFASVEVSVGTSSMPNAPRTDDPVVPTAPVDAGLVVTAPAAGECRITYAVSDSGLTLPHDTIELIPSAGAVEDGNVLFYNLAEAKAVTLTAYAYSGTDLVAQSAPATVQMTPCRPTVTVAPSTCVVPRVFTATAGLSYGAIEPTTLDPALWTVEFYLDGVRVATDAEAPYAASINASRLVGAHSLVARAVNQFGVATQNSPTGRVVVDSATVLSVTRTAVRSGGYGTVTGTLKAVNNGAALANQKVAVYAWAGSWKPVAVRYTNAAGQASYVAKTAVRTGYQFRYAGVAGLRAATGNGEIGALLPVSASINKASYRAPSSAAVTGKVLVAGTHWVQHQVSRDGRSWAPISTVKVLNTTAKAVTVAPGRGTYYYRVVRLGDARFTASPSNVVKLTVV